MIGMLMGTLGPGQPLRLVDEAVLEVVETEAAEVRLREVPDLAAASMAPCR